MEQIFNSKASISAFNDLAEIIRIKDKESRIKSFEHWYDHNIGKLTAHVSVDNSVPMSDDQAKFEMTKQLSAMLADHIMKHSVTYINKDHFFTEHSCTLYLIARKVAG